MAHWNGHYGTKLYGTGLYGYTPAITLAVQSAAVALDAQLVHMLPLTESLLHPIDVDHRPYSTNVDPRPQFVDTDARVYANVDPRPRFVEIDARPYFANVDPQKP